jgi:hypothetical protein
MYARIGSLRLHVSGTAVHSSAYVDRRPLFFSREKVNDANQVVIVDLADANNVIRRPSESSCWK